ncbi:MULTISPECIES: OmpW family outer membrane protein [unclassified Novosphingobium]|uniref:OmpW/AlkL family protein n=1 Tax=unclassified Novosphingobium TaxID=2644732 RepID=UPI00146B22CA|nr:MULTISPECIES: OmpW family outer membrane protein [unclassified Novosphingobium]NMN04763.1 outer membrane protein [Novosphingobium sp. SG919]NMN85243.1 outer membrane protein [Novosphingobium sp. SG916]
MKTPLVAASALAIACFPTMALAQHTDSTSPHWYVRAAVGHIAFDEKAQVKVGGEPLPGANGTLSNNTTLTTEFGYHLTPHLSLAATLGIPPETTLTAAGSLAGAGVLGKVRYAPGSYTLRYHFGAPGARIRPYAGAGLNWTIVLKNHDGLLHNIRASDTTGPVVTGGADIALSRRLGAFASVMKVWTRTNASFDMPTPAGLVPGTTRLQMNPTLFQAGVQVRF